MNYKKESEYRTALMELFCELFTDNALIEIPEPYEGVEAALEFSEEVTQYDGDLWTSFINVVQQDTAEIQTFFNSKLGVITLKLREYFFKPPFSNDLQINFSLETFSYEKKKRNSTMMSLMVCLVKIQ